MKIFVTALGIAAIVSTGCNKKMMPAKEEMPMVKTDTVKKQMLMNGIDSFSYAVGVNIAESMEGQGIPGLNETLMAKAMRAVFNKDSLLMTTEQATMTLQEKLKEFADAKTNAAREKALAFFEENKTKPGVITLPNGMQYIVLKEGLAGAAKPALSDTVSVNYTGSLIDGTEFDSNAKSGEPATFPLTGVIKGWTEILQLMPKGSKWKVFIPSELGYGERGAGGVIAPNSPLVFDIELLDIKHAAKK